MAAVIIGVDPHKASHTAVVIGAAEEPLGEVRVRACAAQTGRLLAWAAPWPERTWAIEGADGAGHLLARQLLAASERVLDMQPKLSARVRLLAAGATGKNDPNDARSVAVAALRSPSARAAAADDHAAVLRVWSKRHRDLGRLRTQLVYRLHAVLCELLPGGVATELTAGQAAQLLGSITTCDAVAAARRELAAQFTADLRGTDAQMRDIKKKLTVAVRAAGTQPDQAVRGRPGDRRHGHRRRPRPVPLPQPGPLRRLERHRAGRGFPRASGRSTGCPAAATAGSTTPSTWPRSPRSATGTAKAAPTTTRKGPKARPAKKPCAR
jgi:hypothetical protein